MKWMLLVAAALALAGCSTINRPGGVDPAYPVSGPPSGAPPGRPQRPFSEMSGSVSDFDWDP
jgi:hypothetical protein